MENKNSMQVVEHLRQVVNSGRSINFPVLGFFWYLAEVLGEDLSEARNEITKILEVYFDKNMVGRGVDAEENYIYFIGQFLVISKLLGVDVRNLLKRYLVTNDNLARCPSIWPAKFYGVSDAVAKQSGLRIVRHLDATEAMAKLINKE